MLLKKSEEESELINEVQLCRKIYAYDLIWIVDGVHMVCSQNQSF
jgi:hypothetical protein